MNSQTPRCSHLENSHSSIILDKEVIENSHIGIVTINTCSAIIYISEPACKIMGIRKAAGIGRKLSEYISHSFSDIYYERLKRCFKGERLPPKEYLMQREDGTCFWSELYALSHIFSNDKIQGLNVAIRDITERKSADIKLGETEAGFTAFIESIDDLIFSIDPERFGLLKYNSAFKRYILKNYKMEIRSGKGIDELLPETNAEKISALCRKTLIEKKVRQRLEVESSNRIFDIVSNLILYNGASIGILIVAKDITKQLKKEIKLNQYIEKLKLKRKEETGEKEQDELKAGLISFISHEFRAPLTTVSLSAQLLERYSNKWDNEICNNQLSRIKHNIEYLNEMLDTLVALCGTETNGISFDPQNINLRRICDNVIEDIRLLLVPRHIFLHDINLDCNYYFYDGRIIKHILMNLLSNAVKYSPGGGKIELKVSANKESIFIEISDEGIGIPPKDRASVYRAFFRSNNTINIRGTGLGLTITKKIITLVKGQIHFESREGIGTTFKVILPLWKK
ncbi:MAG: PAS domain-containing sensor histidine kinase [Ignavibacteria bacterium]|jgi:PAS domain S-box-containing protein